MKEGKTYKCGTYDVVALGGLRKGNKYDYITFHLQATIDRGGFKIEHVLDIIKDRDKDNHWVSPENTLIVIKPISVDKDCPHGKVDKMEQEVFDFLLETIKKRQANEKGIPYKEELEIPDASLIRNLIVESGPEEAYLVMGSAFLVYEALKKSSEKEDEKTWN